MSPSPTEDPKQAMVILDGRLFAWDPYGQYEVATPYKWWVPSHRLAKRRQRKFEKQF